MVILPNKLKAAGLLNFQWIADVTGLRMITTLLVINPFIPNAPFLYPLKTSENLTGQRKRTLGKNRLMNSPMFK